MHAFCWIFVSFQLTAVHNIQSAFEESISYSRYHPSKGYWWEFKEKDQDKTGNNSNLATTSYPCNIL